MYLIKYLLIASIELIMVLVGFNGYSYYNFIV